MNKILLFFSNWVCNRNAFLLTTDIGKKQIVFLKPIRSAKKGY